MTAQTVTGRSGDVPETAIEGLREQLRGTLIRPGDEGYDAARRVWNGMIDKHPGLIARCTGAADVVAAVNLAREHDLVVAVRGGGHNVAGNAVCDGGLVIDLSQMKGVRVDPGRQVARAQAGCTWGDFDHETQAFGLATTGGLISTTGVAGLTLGGGIGWLLRKHGLSCDDLVAADVVTAAGEVVQASAEENADLLWGLRGGGGNFGVVTSFEFGVHPVGQVLGGMVAHPAERCRDLLAFCREYFQSTPDELTPMIAAHMAPPLPFVPAEVVGKPIISVVACYTGDLKEGEEVLRPLHEFGPPALDLFQPMPYTVLQSMLDASVPAGLQNYWKAEYLQDLTDEAIDAFASHTASFLSPWTMAHLQQLGGAAGRVAGDATAFGHRDAPQVMNLISIWEDPVDSPDNIGWTRDFYEAMKPFSHGGVYVNFLGDEGADRVKAAYGGNYDRLVALKDKYDPTNLFRVNQNIKPTA